MLSYAVSKAPNKQRRHPRTVTSVFQNLYNSKPLTRSASRTGTPNPPLLNRHPLNPKPHHPQNLNLHHHHPLTPLTPIVVPLQQPHPHGPTLCYITPRPPTPTPIQTSPQPPSPPIQAEPSPAPTPAPNPALSQNISLPPTRAGPIPLIPKHPYQIPTSHATYQQHTPPHDPELYPPQPILYNLPLMAHQSPPQPIPPFYLSNRHPHFCQTMNLTQHQHQHHYLLPRTRPIPLPSNPTPPQDLPPLT